MNQDLIAATHQTYDEYLVSLKRLDAYGEGTIDEPSALVKIARQTNVKTDPEHELASVDLNILTVQTAECMCT